MLRCHVVFGLAGVISAVTVCLPSGMAVASADGGEQVGEAALTRATSAVVADPSEKVRVQAALVLGRRGDARATPFLIRALSDPSPSVRAMAAKALGDVGDERARPALLVVAAEPNVLVRRHAAKAIRAYDARPTVAGIAVEPMGDQTQQASFVLRERMRGFVAAELRGSKAPPRGSSYTVAGDIKMLSMSQHLDLVEIKCAVELSLRSDSDRKVTTSSGQGVVQWPLRQFLPAMRQAMEMEALQEAVRLAADGLREHFAAN